MLPPKPFQGESKFEMKPRYEFHPLTPARWGDLETLFGERGACGGCWCMYWRLARPQFEKQKGAGNRRAFKRLVGSGLPPGILAYRDGRPIGWCAVGPRESYPVLERSRTLRRFDDRPVWSVTCLFVARPERRQGLSVELLRAAASHARRRGASLIEGYPVEARTGRLPDAFAWTGLPAAFRRAGFVEVARRSPTRPFMRRLIG
jgi:GNAT superfamily N-acetyltransferase